MITGNLTPETVAGFFLMCHPFPDEITKEALSELIRVCWRAGYEAGKVEDAVK